MRGQDYSFRWVIHIFDDYREVDGVKLPFTVHSSSEVGKFIARFDESRHNIPLKRLGSRSHDPALAAATTDEYIQDEMKKRRIPGLALAVIKNGEIVKMNSYGVANLEHDVRSRQILFSHGWLP